MKIFRCSMFALVLATAFPASAQIDPLTVWAGGETINNIIANISDKARDRIAQIEGVGSNILMEGRTHIIVALQNAELMADRLRGKTFAELSDQQKRFFGNLKIALDQFDRTKNDSFEQIKEVIADVDLAIGTIPGADQSPRIARYSPSYVVLDKSKLFEVKIDGSWIGYGDPSLVIGKVECSRKSKTDRNISFSCEKSSLAQCDVIKGRTLKLKVFDRPGWFSWLLGAFREAPSYDFDIGVSCVPEKAADIDGTLALSVMNMERRNRDQSWWVGKGHCEGPTPINWVVNADAVGGWQIDVTKVKPVETTKIGNTSWQLMDLTAASFAVRGSVGNHGRCGPRVFGQHIGVDGRGSLGIRVDFEEFRFVPAESKKQIDSFQMAWDNHYTLPMPDGTKGFIINVRQIDGKQRVATSNGDYGWFTVEQNVDSKVINVRVKSAQDAFSAN